jgi:hypothetical protein
MAYVPTMRALPAHFYPDRAQLLRQTNIQPTPTNNKLRERERERERERVKIQVR